MSEHFLGLNFVPFTSLFKTGLVTFRCFSVKSARGEESILILYEHLLPFCILHVVARFCRLSSTVFHARLVPIISQNKHPVVSRGLISALERRVLTGMYQYGTCDFFFFPSWFMFKPLKTSQITNESFVSTVILSTGNELRNLCYCPPTLFYVAK
jgi:hypothetical protein